MLKGAAARSLSAEAALEETNGLELQGGSTEWLLGAQAEVGACGAAHCVETFLKNSGLGLSLKDLATQLETRGSKRRQVTPPLLPRGREC